MNELVVWSDRGHRTGSGDVKSINPFPIYELGAAFQQYKEAAKNERATQFDQFSAVMDAEMHIKRLLDSDFAIGYCRETAEAVHRRLKALGTRFRDEHGSFQLPERPLPGYELGVLISSMETFEHQLSAEMKKIGTYIVPERGIFNTEQLVDSADNHIHEDVRDYVSKFARSEFRKAGRCLAFGLYSASGFHSARAVESVMRDYYAIYMGGPPKKEDAGLGLMASHLEALHNKKQKPKILPSENTVRHLRDFSKLDRNPLIHPNDEFDLQEIDAYTLFNSALGVIVEMAKALRQENDALSVTDVLPPSSDPAAPVQAS